ncbi:MAG: DNA/RNA non-specific endonuclease [Bacteroidota bacterium]
MKLNKLLIYPAVLIVLLAASCRKNDSNGVTPPPDTTNPVTPPTPKPFAIKEDFESGKVKGGYADDSVILATGVWDMDDALVGNLAADVKNGARSVRLRNGSVSMKFDIANVTKIKISHAKYGTDATTTWVLQMSTDHGATYTQVGNTITETSTTLVTDSFTVSTTAKVRFKISRTAPSSLSSPPRNDIDDLIFIGAGDPGIVAGTPDGGADTGGSTSTPAGSRPVVLGGADVPPATGDNSNLLFGNPSGAQTTLVMGDNYLIDQGYYVESYNATRGEPNWVSWHLDASNTTNATDRLDNFAAWSALPAGFYAVQSNSFSGSGFDRGHNCPSADRTSSTAANGATFLMTNMIPQAPQNNQQTWNGLEGYLRTQTLEGNEVYIIMGSYGTGGTGSNGAATTINSGHVTVPSNVWKVAIIIPIGNGDIARVGATTRVIAVNTPNINTIDPNWTKYIVTVRAIEQATGYNLLSALPQSVQDAVEVTKDAGL